MTIDGVDVTAANRETLLDVRRHKVSMVFQHFGLLPHRTLVDNVAFGLELRGVDKTTAGDGRTRRSSSSASAGWAPTDRISSAAASSSVSVSPGRWRPIPAIMLFDEPFSALDPLIRRDMQDEVVRLRREVNKTMVFITHDLSEALRLGDRIAIMRDGRFVQVGTPQEVVTEPADDYVRNFVRDVPRVIVVPVEAVMSPPNEANGDRFSATCRPAPRSATSCRCSPRATCRSQSSTPAARESACVDRVRRAAA